jgi:hypothetical protein
MKQTIVTALSQLLSRRAQRGVQPGSSIAKLDRAHDLEGYFEIDAKQGFQALEILNMTTRMLGFSPFLNANLPSRAGHHDYSQTAQSSNALKFANLRSARSQCCHARTYPADFIL